ncbi:hypothetical protein QE152_g36240 [Popillia japonica]|uniref:Uncharacterized protein n=1 Tax=Popillia japonica TaxID=7064 RepID=A0AAW1IDL2_POPJA
MEDPAEPKQAYTYKKNDDVASFIKISYEFANFLAGLEEDDNDVIKQRIQREDTQANKGCQIKDKLKNWNDQITKSRNCYEEQRANVIHCYRRHPTKTLLCSGCINEFQKSVKKV